MEFVEWVAFERIWRHFTKRGIFAKEYSSLNIEWVALISGLGTKCNTMIYMNFV